MNSVGLITQLCSRRGILLSPQYKRTLMNCSSRWLTTTTAFKNPQQTETEDFFKKNERLNRPLSPHLTIYKFPLPPVLSITHRGTGLALSALTSGLAIGMLALPGNFPHYICLLESTHLGSAVLFSAKLALAFPFFFHFFNGMRHLTWDMGWGLQMKTLYQTGYFVIGLSAVVSIIAASM